MNQGTITAQNQTNFGPKLGTKCPVKLKQPTGRIQGQTGRHGTHETSLPPAGTTKRKTAEKVAKTENF